LTPHLILSIVGVSMLKVGILGLVHYGLDPRDLDRPRKQRMDRDGLSLEAGVILDLVHRCDWASEITVDVLLCSRKWSSLWPISICEILQDAANGAGCHHVP
jgi:hypothetical protein